MSDQKLINDARSSTIGLIYQFYIAVLKCFEMTEGQKVILERYGDVTVSASQQLEIKCYGDLLTDGHINFWNTLNNWLQPNFDAAQYSALVLFTTQKIGPNSSLRGWNEAAPEARLEILKNITAEGEAREQKRQIAKKRLGDTPDILLLQRRVMEPLRNDKLRQVLARFVIADTSPDLSKLHARLKQIHCKGILERTRDDFLSFLLGYILTPSVAEGKSWEINYSEFSDKVAALTALYHKGTSRFPVKYRRTPKDEDLSALHDNPFTTKIRDIQYHEVISKAISDYLYASNTVCEEFREYNAPTDNYKVFADEVLDQIEPIRRIALKSVKDIILDSQTFYDNVMRLPVPTFSGFETPFPSFRNGVIHMHFDDPNKKLKWRLERE